MVHWSPFVMSFKKKYPWIQLAGHAGSCSPPLPAGPPAPLGGTQRMRAGRGAPGMLPGMEASGTASLRPCGLQSQPDCRMWPWRCPEDSCPLQSPCCPFPKHTHVPPSSVSVAFGLSLPLCLSST